MLAYGDMQFSDCIIKRLDALRPDALLRGGNFLLLPSELTVKERPGFSVRPLGSWGRTMANPI